MFFVTVPPHRISLLYVDDEPALLDLAKQFLELRDGFDVDTAHSAAEALDILQTKAYDGVISDYQMPETDGLGLLKRIRLRYPDLPFILFTGRGREEVVIQAFDAGADYYVQKGGEARSQFRELSHKIRLAVEKRTVEKALKASEEQYRNVVEDQTEFICRFRPDGIHNFVNDAYCRYFGIPREKIIGHRFIPRIPDDDSGTVRSHFASLTRDSPVSTVVHRLIMPDGSVRWHQWSDRAIFDESGTLIEYQSVGRDITNRKIVELDLQKKSKEIGAANEQLTAIEEELRTSYDDLAASQRTLETREANLNAVIQESPISQFVIGRDHKILYWNHALAIYSGIEAEEVVGTDQQWRAFYPDKRPCLADLLVDNALDRIPEWYRDKFSKSTLTDDAYEATDFFPRKGKEGKWLHFTAGLIRDRDGDIIGAVESLEDITGRKNAELALLKKNEELHAAYEQVTAVEEELRTSYDDLAANQGTLEMREANLNAVIQESPISQFVIGRDHKILYWNHALAVSSGIEAEEVVGTDQQWRAFYPDKRPCLADLLVDNAPDKIPEWYPGKYAKSALIDDAYEATDVFPRKGKEGKWLHFTAGLIRDRDGNIIGAVESLEDITGRKNAELELLKKNEELHAAYEQLTAVEEELRTSFDDLVKAQHDLAGSEARYRNVVEDQTEFICRFRPDGTHNFVNDAYCRYFGLKKEDVIGHRFIPRIPEDDAGTIRAHFASLTRDRPLSTIEHRLIMSDGSVCWHQWSDRAIFDESGTLVEYQSVGRDITSRKTTERDLLKKNEDLHAAYEQVTAVEEELRQNYDELAKSQHNLAESEQKVRISEAFLSSVINDAREGIMVCDREFNCILWNRFMEDLTGIPAAEVLGRQATEVFPVLREAGTDRLMEQALSGHTVESSDFSFRIDWSGREGRVRAIYSPLTDTDGAITGVIGIIQDTEARKVMEHALQTTIEELMESEEKYRNVFNAKNDPLLLVNTRTRAILDLNNAATDLYGYSREEMLTMSLLDLSAEPEKTTDAIARRVPRVRMRYHRKKDGSVFSADISSGYFDLKGLSVLVLSVRDLSPVQQMADALRLANVKLNLMIGITRHDVLNKLTTLIGYNCLLKDKTADTAALEMLEKQETALSAIRRQIEFTRDYDDLGVKSPVWQDVCKTASSAYAQFMDTISFTCETASLEIYADPMLEKVFYNLFDNAFRHGEGISRIRIHYKKKGTELRLFFEDDGIGIPAEDKEQVFSRGVGKNTGLGLYISREILGLTLIEIHETGTYRKGARFELRVPERAFRFLE